MSSYPLSIPLFPLNGVILLPGGILPLHIFEPRYKQMVQDLQAGEPYLGMIQPRSLDNEGELYTIGCLGKMDSCQELPNGNYMIRLQGRRRFRLAKEITANTPYRKALVDYSDFYHDEETGPPLPDASFLHMTFHTYAQQQQMQIDWDKLATIPVHHLVHILCMNLAFSSAEKQALLEAHDLPSRTEMLITLMQMNTPAPFGLPPEKKYTN